MTGTAIPEPTAGETGAAWLAATVLPLLAGSLAGIVYLLTLPPGLTWANFGGDGGELITAAVTLGVPHPPGYPTYTLLGKLWSLLPLPGSMAWRFNLLSALTMATAVAFAAATAREALAGARWSFAAALAAALALAFAPLVWGQAIVAEVYALHMALLAAFLWALLGGRASWLSGLLLGLAVTAHLTALAMLPLALAQTPRRRWVELLAGFAAGLLPFLLLPLFGSLGSPIVWGDPTTLEGWWWLVSARLYAPNLALIDPARAAPSPVAWAALVLRQWLWVGWLFVVWGVSAAPPDRAQRLGLSLTALFYLLYAFLYRTDDAAVLILPALLLLTPLLAAGLCRTGPLALLLPLALLVSGFLAQDLRADTLVHTRAQAQFAAAPPSAILLTPGDPSIAALWYTHHIEGRRPDLALVDANLLAFDWYRARLRARYPDLRGLDLDDLGQFRALNSTQRPFCEVAPQLAAPPQCRLPGG